MEFSKGMSQGKEKIRAKVSEMLILESNFYFYFFFIRYSYINPTYGETSLK